MKGLDLRLEPPHKILFDFAGLVWSVHVIQKLINLCTQVMRTVRKIDCSQSPIFSWDRLDIPRPRRYTGGVSGIIALVGKGGGGDEKNFLASSQTAPAP